MKITALEMELMNDIVTNEYANGQRAANVHVWTASVIKTRSRAAVLGSLVKKGLAGRDNFGKDGDLDDACCWLTDAGFAEWATRWRPRPASSMELRETAKSATRVESRRYRIAVLNAKGEAEYFLNSENELTIFEDKARLFWSLTSAEEAGKGMYGSLIRDRDWCIESVEMVVDRVKGIR